jgi:uncharacterized protein YggU (UPF0235/DUF167 family)
MMFNDSKLTNQVVLSATPINGKSNAYITVDLKANVTVYKNDIQFLGGRPYKKDKGDSKSPPHY